MIAPPARGRVMTAARRWTSAKRDRLGDADQGGDPPYVTYGYAPDRKTERPIARLSSFQDVLQVAGYAGCRSLAEKHDVRLAFC